MQAPFKTWMPASPERVTIILFPCHVPKATCTLPHPHVKRHVKKEGSEGKQREVRIPTPGHPRGRSRTETVLRVAGSK